MNFMVDRLMHMNGLNEQLLDLVEVTERKSKPKEI